MSYCFAMSWHYRMLLEWDLPPEFVVRECRSRQEVPHLLPIERTHLQETEELISWPLTCRHLSNRYEELFNFTEIESIYISDEGGSELKKPLRDSYENV